MSQFEYVSVASALVYSLAIARLLGGLPHTSAKGRGSSVVLVWNLGLILGALTTWWIFWRFNDLDWNATAFVWAICAPGFIYLSAAVLLTDEPSEVADWESHYMAGRKRFFGIQIAQAFHTALTPWVLGAFAWFAPAPGHIGAAIALVTSAIGLASTSSRTHLLIATILFVMTVTFLFLIPSHLGAAA